VPGKVNIGSRNLDSIGGLRGWEDAVGEGLLLT